ncbi:MAG: hypothetical protein H6727_12585 [Myxococcales bacterium]|nr:hypothetical protein [Myxococcales bacterium]
MTLEEMKKMAYWHADAESPGPFCPGCYSPLHGDLAFFWHKQCFLQTASPSALPTSVPHRSNAQRAQPRYARPRPKPIQTQQPTHSFETFSTPILRCNPTTR